MALIFISLMTNDFESIFHVCKILAMQKKLHLKNLLPTLPFSQTDLTMLYFQPLL